MIPKVEQLRQALIAMQMHAAGMHAAAELAMTLLGEVRGAEGAGGRPRETPYRAGAAHYGDEPAPEIQMERLFADLQADGGSAPSTAQGAESPPQE